MVEFIKSVHKRGIIANVLHVLFNIAYVVVVMALVMLFPGTPWPALALVLVAKWRVVAVRPRYWWVNTLSNLPDALFGLGIVTLMWVGAIWQIQVALTVIYAAWLIILKPQHRKHLVMAQAGVSQFVALTALFSVSHYLPVWLVVGLVFVIGFAIARQVLSQYNEKALSFLSLIWGLALAELSFVAWHWAIAYPIVRPLQIPQFAIIVAVLGLVAERSYAAWHNDEKIDWNEISVAAIFAGVVIFVLLFLFSGLFDATTL
jgi:hypothetical protein